MNELEKLLKRTKDLEKIAERTKDQEKELVIAMGRVSELEKERDLNSNKAEVKMAEMERNLQIREAGDKFDAGSEMIRKFVDDTTKTVQDFKDALLAERMATPNIPANVMSENGSKDIVRDIEDSMVLRLGGNLENVRAGAMKFSNATLSDMARAMFNIDSFDKEVIAERAMKTADFPNLLLSAGNRVLNAEFESAFASYRTFATAIDVPDFRENSDITRGMGGRLDKYYETGELKEKHLGEASEKWSLESYGNKFVLTRKMIINDDLGAFTDMLSLFGEMAALTANGLVFDMIQGRGEFANYKMSDGKPIFDNAHKNKGNSALDATSLAGGRSAMRKHKGLDGETALNIAPKYLIVGPDLEQTAYELINSTGKVENEKSSGVVNFHQGAMEVIVDAEIPGDSWFLSADRRGIKVGYLAGTGRRPVLKLNETTLTQTTFEGIFDFGVVPVDYRGLYQGK